MNKYLLSDDHLTYSADLAIELPQKQQCMSVRGSDDHTLINRCSMFLFDFEKKYDINYGFSRKKYFIILLMLIYSIAYVV